MVAGRRGHHAVCRAGLASALAIAVTPHPHTGAKAAVAMPQSAAILSVVQVRRFAVCQ